MNTAQMVTESDENGKVYRLSGTKLCYIPNKGFMTTNGKQNKMCVAIGGFLHRESWVEKTLDESTSDPQPVV